MASIFTYETEPVKVASPWPLASAAKADPDSRHGNVQAPHHLAGMEMPVAEPLSRCGILKLDAEPQEGPTEYKLHLLLRPRRSFSASSTVQKVSGSYLSKSRSPVSLQASKDRSGTSSPSLAPSSQSRQNRLQHLTTQLLWRLQQSSPHHSSSKSDLILPVLPEADSVFSASEAPVRLLTGLEESLGALYEIGVSDDGTFVGLTMDELEESLQVLRAMAHSLGCIPRVLRWVIVGHCQWKEEPLPNLEDGGRTRSEKLWVAEVLVAPHLKARREATYASEDVTAGSQIPRGIVDRRIADGKDWGEPLRVSLTGSTTSGKSSLLGTLSTSTLDNGRGKSRLSLLKHRHEIVSGVTSSLAQELIGYYDTAQPSSTGASGTNIVNYSSGNVSSWTDIHNASEAGRLVFVTDSAGHPKFRRTTVRGLISWAPHWTLCCIAADDDEDSTGRVGATASSSDVLGSVGKGVDLSKSHLELCLKLDLALVVVITKLDLASRHGLRQTVAKVLSTLKIAGRTPAVLAGTAPHLGIADPSGILGADSEAVRRVIESLHKYERHRLVPIVLTSALTGAGIGQTHSLLRQLPVIQYSRGEEDKSHAIPCKRLLPRTVFHVDEIFAVTGSHNDQIVNGTKASPRFILSGYLRYGSLETGDTLLVGPFMADERSVLSTDIKPHRSRSFPGLGKSPPKDLSAYATNDGEVSEDFTAVPRHHSSNRNAASAWQSVQVTSLRYLRLPVRKLSQGQVGTVAIFASESLYLSAEPCLRRGMVLLQPSIGSPPPAFSCITAVFADPYIYVNPGSSVTLYTASIRTLAKIVEVKVPEHTDKREEERVNDAFAFDDSDSLDISADDVLDALPRLEEIEITFRFLNSREWVEMDTKVLVTPASGISMLSPPQHDGDAEGAGTSNGTVAGLDGFVGRIVRATA